MVVLQWHVLMRGRGSLVKIKEYLMQQIRVTDASVASFIIRNICIRLAQRSHEHMKLTRMLTT